MVNASALKRMAIRGGRILALIYLSTLGSVYFLQEKLLFYPTDATAEALHSAQQNYGAEEIVIATDAGHIRGAFVSGDGEGPRPTVVYFGGNAENIWLRIERFAWLREMGVNFAFCSYRSYDMSDGEPSAAAFLDDALALYDHLRTRPDVDATGIIPWGFSLGTGPAVRIAAERPVKGVILNAPYSRLSDAAAYHYPWLPVRAFFRHEIDSLARIPNVVAPIFIAHGNDDGVVPIELSRRLKAHAKAQVNYLAVDNLGHRSILSHPDALAAVQNFLRGILARAVAP